MIETARVAEWDAEVERLLAEARAERSAEIAVPLPGSLSATALLRLQDDPDAFARDWPGRCRGSRSRPAGSAPCSTPGSRTASSSSLSSTPTTCPAAPISGSTTTPTSTSVIAAFEKGPFADRVPHAVEAPFALVLAGQVVRGRIDAVYDEPDGTASCSSTGRPTVTRTPTRSSSRSTGWPGPSSAACRWSGCARRSTTSAPASTVEPEDLPDRQALEAMLGALSVASHAATPRAATRPARLAPMVLAEGP